MTSFCSRIREETCPPVPACESLPSGISSRKCHHHRARISQPAQLSPSSALFDLSWSFSVQRKPAVFLLLQAPVQALLQVQVLRQVRVRKSSASLLPRRTQQVACPAHPYLFQNLYNRPLNIHLHIIYRLDSAVSYYSIHS